MNQATGDAMSKLRKVDKNDIRALSERLMKDAPEAGKNDGVFLHAIKCVSPDTIHCTATMTASLEGLLYDLWYHGRVEFEMPVLTEWTEHVSGPYLYRNGFFDQVAVLQRFLREYAHVVEVHCSSHDLDTPACVGRVVLIAHNY